MIDDSARVSQVMRVSPKIILWNEKKGVDFCEQIWYTISIKIEEGTEPIGTDFFKVITKQCQKGASMGNPPM